MNNWQPVFSTSRFSSLLLKREIVCHSIGVLQRRALNSRMTWESWASYTGRLWCIFKCTAVALVTSYHGSSQGCLIPAPSTSSSSSCSTHSTHSPMWDTRSHSWLFVRFHVELFSDCLKGEGASIKLHSGYSYFMFFLIEGHLSCYYRASTSRRLLT